MKKIADSKIFGRAAGLALSFAGGFMLSGTTIAGIASFADISLTGAVSLSNAAAAFSGALVRCVLTNSVGKCIVKLGAMAVILIAKMFSRIFSQPVGCGAVTTAAIILSGSAISALIGEFPEKLIFYSLYGVISGFTAYSAAALYDEISAGKAPEFHGSSGYMLGVVYIVASASICSAELPFINVGLALISAVTAAGAYFYSGFGGVICGALGASGAFLASAEIGTAAAILPAAGLLTGFIGRNRLFLSASFYSFFCFFLSLLMVESYHFGLTVSIICGGGVFLAAAPHFKEKRFMMHIGERENSADSMAIKNAFLSDVIEAVRCDSGKISAALIAAQREKSADEKYDNNVCGVCYRRGICGSGQWEASGELIPVVPDDCVRKKEAAEEFERLFRLRTAQRLMELRYSGERRFLSEQFRIISDIIRDTGRKDTVRYSRSLAVRVENALKNHDIKFQRVMAGYTLSDRITVEIFFSSGEIAESAERICGILSDTLEVRLLSAASVSSANELKMGIYQPPEYELEIHSAAKCAAGCGISGDSSSVFTDSTGRQYIVLSDGMGSGKTAAVDSHMVIGIFRRLVCGGMKPESAVRVVNSVMVTKSREESFATLDAVIIDPESCMAVSVKSGAAPTIIRRGNDVIKLSSPVFPIGIVEEAELFVSEQKLSEGDMIIMFSDGITENAYLFIKELLLGGGDIREIVTEIALKAEVFNPASRTDDVTVIGMKIVKK